MKQEPELQVALPYAVLEPGDFIGSTEMDVKIDEEPLGLFFVRANTKFNPFYEGFKKVDSYSEMISGLPIIKIFVRGSDEFTHFFYRDNPTYELKTSNRLKALNVGDVFWKVVNSPANQVVSEEKIKEYLKKSPEDIMSDLEKIHNMAKEKGIEYSSENYRIK